MDELLLLLLEPWQKIERFLDAGGPILWSLLPITAVLWTLMLERYWYIRRIHPKTRKALTAEWKARPERQSRAAHRIREELISVVHDRLVSTLPLISTLIALCPMMGLLGTVTGMIEVFDVMALQGTGDARSMAGGVSRATLPTMAGMVVALSGLFFASRLKRLVNKKTSQFADSLGFV